MSSLRIWRAVPDGSRLEMGVVPPTGPFTARARVLEEPPDPAAETLYGDDVLRLDPPARHPLRSPRVYAVRLRIAFAQEGTARIRALVRKPGGQIYGEPYQYTVQGSAGLVARATLVLTTRQ